MRPIKFTSLNSSTYISWWLCIFSAFQCTPNPLVRFINSCLWWRINRLYRHLAISIALSLKQSRTPSATSTLDVSIYILRSEYLSNASKNPFAEHPNVSLCFQSGLLGRVDLRSHMADFLLSQLRSRTFRGDRILIVREHQGCFYNWDRTFFDSLSDPRVARIRERLSSRIILPPYLELRYYSFQNCWSNYLVFCFCGRQFPCY
jgi:hypothetical protein